MPPPTHLEVEIAQQLATNMTSDAVVVATYGVDVFAGPEKEASPDNFTPSGALIAIPHKSIWVLQSDGLDSEIASASQDQSRPQIFERPIFDILVRAALDELGADTAYTDGRDLAEAAARAINRRPPAGWVDCFVVGTRARYEGLDDRKRHRWILRLVGEKQGTLGG